MGRAGRADGGRRRCVLVGYYEDGAAFLAGHVGTGFKMPSCAIGHGLLDGPPCPSPLVDGDVPRDARWVRPELVVEVEFAEWTGDGRLRHPVMLGRHDDVDPHRGAPGDADRSDGCEQLLEQRPVAEHRVTEILGRGAAVAAAALEIVRSRR